MGTSVLSDATKDIFFYTTEGNFTEVKRIVTDLKLPVNCYDEKGITPLQHAAFKGHYEIAKLLLDCGADVNDSKDLYGYTALSMAAISNRCDVVTLLLEYGANPAAINSNKRTAAEMAAFIGNHKAATIINNYITKDAIDYFTEIHGLEPEPRLPLFLSSPVHKFVIMPTVHPVRIILHLQSNNIILQNFKSIVDVLNIMAEKQLKEMENDRLSLKLHHYAFVLSSASDFIISQKKSTEEDISQKKSTEEDISQKKSAEEDISQKKSTEEDISLKKPTEEEISDEKFLDALIKSLLKGYKDGFEIPISLEKFLRKSIADYPFESCLLYRKIVSSIMNTEVGDEPNTLILFNNAILGQTNFENESCATCGDQGSLKHCLGCKKVQYCNRTCQKLHWFGHKNFCKK